MQHVQHVSNFSSPNFIHNCTMEEFTQQLAIYVVGEVEYENLRSIIEAAKKEKTIEVFRKPTPSFSRIMSEDDAQAALITADEHFECQEWLEAFRIYIKLHDLRVGPKSIASKLSLCCVELGDMPAAFELAKQAIIDTPLDANAYIAMAIMKGSMRYRTVSLQESQRLLQLAELTSNPDIHRIAVQRRQNDINQDIAQRELDAFHHLMKFNPDFIESYRTSSEHHNVEDIDAVLNSMARVKENPHCLREECMSNPEFGKLLMANRILPAIPRHFDQQSLRQLAQPDCPFHRINPSAFLAIMKYLSYRDLIRLRRTCRFLEYIGGFPDNFKLIVLRLGIGGPPAQYWMAKGKESDWQDVLIAHRIVKNFLAFYLTIAKVDFEKESCRQFYSDQLRQFSLTHHIYANEQYTASPTIVWMMISIQCHQTAENRFAKRLVTSPHLFEMIEYALSNPTPNYFRDYQGVISMLINLIVLGNAKGPFPASLENRLWSLLGNKDDKQTCAALAVLCNAPRLAEMNLITVCDKLAGKSPNHQSKYLVLDGIWQGVQMYTAYHLKDIREECIMNLKFPSIVVDQALPYGPSPFEMIGTGIDSFGEFELERPIINIPDLTVTFTKVYRRLNHQNFAPIKHYYLGVVYPCGIGGTFVHSLENKFIQIGFFFYGRPLACADATTVRSPSLPDTWHTATMSWDDLLPSISKRAEENAVVKQALLQRFKSEEYADMPIYQVQLVDETSKLVSRMRRANRLSLVAVLPSTTISEMRTYLSSVQHEETIKSGQEVTLERYPTDSDTKWNLRCLMIRATIFESKTAREYLSLLHLDSLIEIGKILERFNFDSSNPQVKQAIQRYSQICQSTTPSLDLSARSIFGFIKELEFE